MSESLFKGGCRLYCFPPFICKNYRMESGKSPVQADVDEREYASLGDVFDLNGRLANDEITRK